MPAFYILQSVTTKKFYVGSALNVSEQVDIERAGKLGWAQSELSKRSKLALGTVCRMEGLNGPVGTRMETLGKVVSVLEKAGVEFLNDKRPGVRLKKRG